MPNLGFLLTFSRARSGGGGRVAGNQQLCSKNDHWFWSSSKGQSSQISPTVDMAEAKRSGAHPWRVLEGSSTQWLVKLRQGLGGVDLGEKQSHRQT